MNLSSILQVAVVFAAVSRCSSHLVGAQKSAVGCAGSQLDDIIRRISLARLETRNTKPKLARCRTFAQLIRGQPELESAGLAIDEPASVLDKIVRIFEQRASCSGQPMGGLSSLQEFAEDCQELIELADVKCASSEPAAAKGTAVQVGPGRMVEIEMHKGGNGKLGVFWRYDLHGTVFVTRVTAGTPAARAGLRFGDQLVQVNGRAVAGKDAAQMIADLNPVKLLVRKSPMEQTFVLKPEQGEGPGFVWSKQDLIVTEIEPDQAAARAGLLRDFKLIAVNGECVIGLDDVTLTGHEYTVTVMPVSFFNRITYDISAANIAQIRIESNKILADEKAAGRA